mmetsp:Transcript_15160/g.17027  ORF Transcript_15160/g.17027 Transcript_15160/m.17027 type:complete len:91 (-) Transcript_15160:84-356(-)
MHGVTAADVTKDKCWEHTLTRVFIDNKATQHLLCWWGLLGVTIFWSNHPRLLYHINRHSFVVGSGVIHPFGTNMYPIVLKYFIIIIIIII